MFARAESLVEVRGAGRCADKRVRGLVVRRETGVREPRYGWLDPGMTRDLVRPRKGRPGDRIAVLSPSFAAPGAFPAVHEQAMRRLSEVSGLVPVEYPTTRMLGASPERRAADINAAFADPAVRAILATIGGEDQITVVPHLDPEAALADPKPFLGTSDNTNLHHWLWGLGIASFYGGSSQVHLGPGPAVDDVHARSLRAALLTGETLEVTDPGEAEDVGVDWADPRALAQFGQREPTRPWDWYGPRRRVTGRTWGGCLEVMEWILAAGRFAFPAAALTGGVLLIETSEELLPAPNVGRIVRSLGERGILAAVDAVLVARPPVSDLTRRPDAEERVRLREAQRDTVVEVVTRYNPDAVICVGVPFGHTRPQWILPHGGQVTVDGTERRVFADYR
jgi:muramoyltetrapeptide carboxypeptidase LdcA involved in peptidoglycan recycling